MIRQRVEIFLCTRLGEQEPCEVAAAHGAANRNVFSAKGAVLIKSLGQTPQIIIRKERPALKARFTLATDQFYLQQSAHGVDRAQINPVRTAAQKFLGH